MAKSLFPTFGRFLEFAPFAAMTMTADMLIHNIPPRDRKMVRMETGTLCAAHPG